MGTIATAIYSTVLTNRNVKNIAVEVRKAATDAGIYSRYFAKAIAAAEAGTESAYALIPEITPSIQKAIKLAVKIANIQSLRAMFLVSLAFGIMAIIAS